MLTRYQVRRALGSALILSIDPRSVLMHAGTNMATALWLRRSLVSISEKMPSLSPITSFSQKIIYSLEPFKLPPFVFNRAIPIEEEYRYCLLADLISNKNALDQTIWFRRLKDKLDSSGEAAYKSMKFYRTQEILAFLEGYALNLINSMEISGYNRSIVADVGTAFIDRDGSICKCGAGNHRFSAARLVGARDVPVEILGVDRRWFSEAVGGDGYEGLRRELKKVEARHAIANPRKA